jgi:menaquinone-dependent protoporphyrinogen oxidase
MQPILVAYGTTEGQARKVAEFIADRLRMLGHRVDLVDTATPAAQAVQPIYQAAFIGGSVHYYRHQASVEHFVKANIDWLKGIPTAFFSVGLATLQPDGDERARADQCVQEFLQHTGLAPLKVRHVHGALKYTEYDFLKRQMQKAFHQHLGKASDTANDHEYTDWADVDAFVDEVLSAARLPGRATAR